MEVCLRLRPTARGRVAVQSDDAGRTLAVPGVRPQATVPCDVCPCGHVSHVVISDSEVRSEGGGRTGRMDVEGAWQLAGNTGSGTASMEHSEAVTLWNWSILLNTTSFSSSLNKKRDIALNNKFS